MNLVENKYNCTGCGACSKVCPSSAIKMREDEKGFLYPEILYKLWNVQKDLPKSCRKKRASQSN